MKANNTRCRRAAGLAVLALTAPLGLRAADLPEGTEARVWRKFQKEEKRMGGGKGVPEWLSTHPPTEERLQNAQKDATNSAPTNAPNNAPKNATKEGR